MVSEWFVGSILNIGLHTEKWLQVLLFNFLILFNITNSLKQS